MDRAESSDITVDHPRRTRVLWAAIVFCFLAGGAMGQTADKPSKKSDGQQKLGERLIRKATGDQSDDVMETVMRLMEEASRRLEVDFDVSDQTGKVQRDIIVGLDRAIKAAAAQRRLRRPRDPQSNSDKRRMPTGKKKSDEESARSGDAQQDGESRDTTRAGQAPAQGETARGAMRERRRAWGNLPQREREEIVQGIGDQYLERYRAWIERYYRALQEAEE